MKSATLIINNNKFSTLLAISDIEQQIGLMHRKELPPSMSFIYGSPRVNKFWMKSTYLPLDIIFCCNGKIVDIHKGEPLSTKLIGSNSLSDLVVELPYGTCNKLGFKPGDEVSIPELEIHNLLSNKYY